MPAEAVEASGDITLAPDAPLDLKPILDKGVPDAVVHRVVHGGSRFKEATRLDSTTLAALEELRVLAPLHTGRALAGIRAVSAALPGVTQVACFDTAFHQRMPAHASRYAIPEEWTRTLGIRRYGFHGLSVAYSISEVARRIRPTPPRIIVAHLGSGCSITAVDRGRSADTTMGFTTLEGVMMSTRAGSIDPGILIYLARDKGIPMEVIDRRLETESGLLGVSGVGSDLREVIAASDQNNPKASLAYRMFIHSICRNLGAMLGALGGADVLVFTGGIGEHNPLVRSEVANSFGWAGIRIDPSANATAQGDAEITARPAAGKEPGVRVMVVAAREDLVMAREASALLEPHEASLA
jgi:acetate kinase